MIQHTATPARLDEQLKERLNSFLPRARAALEKIIVENGGRKTQFRFFRAHHLAIALTPAKVAFCLDCTNAAMFLGGLYCFELKSEATKEALTQLLSIHLDLNDPLILEAPRSCVDDPGSANDEDMRALVADCSSFKVFTISCNLAIL